MTTGTKVTHSQTLLSENCQVTAFKIPLVESRRSLKSSQTITLIQSSVRLHQGELLRPSRRRLAEIRCIKSHLMTVLMKITLQNQNNGKIKHQSSSTNKCLENLIKTLNCQVICRFYFNIINYNQVVNTRLGITGFNLKAL